MDEISGIASSRRHPGILYVHNDSGDTSRFFAVSPEGKRVLTCYFRGLEDGKGVKDCEDIAVGAGEKPGRSYIYIGDIGDNRAQRKSITIYRLEEPPMPANGKDSILSVNALAIHLIYPDGPRDAESLMVDPVDKLLYIISKREDSVRVYTVPWSFDARRGLSPDTMILRKRASLYFPGFRPVKYITAGDISADGKQVLLKSYSQVFYWKRRDHEPIWKLLQTLAKTLPYTIEKQGEAIGFTPDGKAYYTTSEGVNAPIYYYRTGQ